MTKKIYDFEDYYPKDNNNFARAIICLILLIALLIATIIIGDIDFIPAKEKDYEPLIAQQEKITEDFNTLYSYDNYSITTDDTNIKVKLSNDECSLICTFDKDLNFVEYKKQDNSYYFFKTLVKAIIFACLCVLFDEFILKKI